MHFGGLAAVSEHDLRRSREGEVVALIGPNGAGKTTAFNAITGYLRADQRHASATAATALDRPRAAARFRQLGVVRTFQKHQRLHAKPASSAERADRPAPALQGSVAAVGDTLLGPALGRAQTEAKLRVSEAGTDPALRRAATNAREDLARHPCPTASSGCWKWPWRWRPSPTMLLLDEPGLGHEPVGDGAAS